MSQSVKDKYQTEKEEVKKHKAVSVPNIKVDERQKEGESKVREEEKSVLEDKMASIGGVWVRFHRGWIISSHRPGRVWRGALLHLI